MSEKKERVVILDDHPLFRERLAELINQELDMEICGEAEDTSTSNRAYSQHIPGSGNSRVQRAGAYQKHKDSSDRGTGTSPFDA
jgi:hypothetical protein